jgi:hypothetical protein
MSLDAITEGSKNYIKHVLQLSEANEFEAWHILHPSPFPSGTNVWPTPEKFKYRTYDTKKREFSSKPKPQLQRPSEDYGNPDTNINISDNPNEGPMWRSGHGGNDFRVNSRPPEDEEFLKTKPYKNKNANTLIPMVLFGGSKLPNIKGKMQSQNSDDPYATTEPDDSGGLDYISNIAQGTSIIDYADQMLPAAAKLALAGSLFGKKVKKTLDSSGDQNNPLSIPSTGNNVLDSFQNDLMNKVQTFAGGKNLGPLGDKVMQFSKNLGALDPLNPLLGLKLGYEMLGGNEILKRTRELGAAQSSGAQSSMGHPSGFGYYGR